MNAPVAQTCCFLAGSRSGTSTEGSLLYALDAPYNH